MMYRLFAYAIVVIYAALGVVSLADRRPREAVIAFLFAASSAAIFFWR